MQRIDLDHLLDLVGVSSEKAVSLNGLNEVLKLLITALEAPAEDLDEVLKGNCLLNVEDNEVYESILKTLLGLNTMIILIQSQIMDLKEKTKVNI